jgi:heme/copper-type cytochrome/quinol oxidase subunit 1
LAPLVRRYIKTSLVFLVVGLLLGVEFLVGEFVLGRYPPRLHITAHVHLLLVGFMLMMVMGVATWMFPRAGRSEARYHPGLAETVYWLVTISTGARALGEVVGGLSAAPWPRTLIVVGGLGQVVAAGLFVVNIWWRVRTPAVGGGE